MTDKEDIKQLKEDMKEWKKFHTEYEIEQGVRTAVKVRCAAAWGSVFVFVSFVCGFLTLHFDILKEASKAALKVIIARIWS